MMFRQHLTFLTAWLTFTSVGLAEPSQDLVIVIGAPGTEEYGQMFAAWARRWEIAAESGEVGCEVIGRDSGKKDAVELQRLLEEKSTIETSEPLWVVLIGHGTFDTREARFNLHGRDISATDFAKTLENSKRPVAIVNCSSCSSPFINALSAPNRTVISATKDGSEMQFARFGAAMSDAIGDLEADVDRDGQTSLLEAWLFAARRTAEYYKSEGRLATEHSLLDDSGDARGTRSEVFDGTRVKSTVTNKAELDGQLSRRWHLVRSAAEKRLTTEQRVQRDELEDQLEALRERRTEFSEEQYLQELERLLLPLAKIYQSS